MTQCTNDVSQNSGRTSLLRARFPLVLGTISVGVWVGNYLGSAIVGSLVGFLVGWRIAELRCRYDSLNGFAKSFPSALLSFILAGVSWAMILMIWGWVFTRPRGTFSDQGGMIITFLVLPGSAFLWLLGGPIAMMAAGHARGQLEAGTRPERDAPIARKGMILSSAMTGAALIIPLWILLRLVG